MMKHHLLQSLFNQIMTKIHIFNLNQQPKNFQNLYKKIYSSHLQLNILKWLIQHLITNPQVKKTLSKEDTRSFFLNSIPKWIFIWYLRRYRLYISIYCMITPNNLKCLLKMLVLDPKKLSYSTKLYKALVHSTQWQSDLLKY
jgi:hypothetical protein